MASERKAGEPSVQAAVADHYNKVRSVGLGKERAQSHIGGIRDFNNLVKRALIVTHLERGQAVLDLCCGKGGDLPKFRIRRPRLAVLVDHADASVREAKRRHDGSFEAQFYVADCHKARLHDALPEGLEFDLVSCQFAFHYALETEDRLRGILRNVSDRLKPGGTFIGTTVDAHALL